MFNSLESKLKGSAYGWKRKLGYYFPWELPRLLQPRESHSSAQLGELLSTGLLHVLSGFRRSGSISGVRSWTRHCVTQDLVGSVCSKDFSQSSPSSPTFCEGGDGTMNTKPPAAGYLGFWNTYELIKVTFCTLSWYLQLFHMHHMSGFSPGTQKCCPSVYVLVSITSLYHRGSSWEWFPTEKWLNKCPV